MKKDIKIIITSNLDLNNDSIDNKFLAFERSYFFMSQLIKIYKNSF